MAPSLWRATQLFVVITKRVPWDPAIAAGTTAPGEVTASAA